METLSLDHHDVDSGHLWPSVRRHADPCFAYPIGCPASERRLNAEADHLCQDFAPPRGKAMETEMVMPNIISLYGDIIIYEIMPMLTTAQPQAIGLKA